MHSINSMLTQIKLTLRRDLLCVLAPLRTILKTSVVWVPLSYIYHPFECETVRTAPSQHEHHGEGGVVGSYPAHIDRRSGGLPELSLSCFIGVIAVPRLTPHHHLLNKSANSGLAQASPVRKKIRPTPHWCFVIRIRRGPKSLCFHPGPVIRLQLRRNGN